MVRSGRDVVNLRAVDELLRRKMHSNVYDVFCLRAEPEIAWIQASHTRETHMYKDPTHNVEPDVCEAWKALMAFESSSCYSSFNQRLLECVRSCEMYHSNKARRK